jgi:hypothetical protein
MNTTTKILMSAGISALVIAALVVVVGVAIPAKAQIFSLTEMQLPAGVYVVTTQGYWPVDEWVAAHPGKAIPASTIVVQEQLLSPAPTQTIKIESTDGHGDGGHHHHHNEQPHERWHHHHGDRPGHGPQQPPKPPTSGGGASNNGGTD